MQATTEIPEAYTLNLNPKRVWPRMDSPRDPNPSIFGVNVKSYPLAV